MKILLPRVAPPAVACPGSVRAAARFSASRHFIRAFLFAGTALVALLFMPLPLHALDMESGLKRMLERETAQLPGRVAIEVDATRFAGRLAPCARAVAYLPTGVRPWGRFVAGMRCVDGASWNVLVPAQVHVYARALVTVRALAAGEIPEASDLRSREIDLTREPAGALTDLGDGAGQVLTRALAAGTVLRREHLRMPNVVAQGEQVKVVYTGNGFSVSTLGRALQPAVAGGSVRVQIESGRILTGVAREGRRVEIGL
ncbi:MAG: flagellar basal body P-ring formation chaperone FlgA [Betaproteobacteria bacterium]|nr:flagellar basal body P-ring formation chaperone FlgA [Betaproteobacteria bacterium]